MLAKDTLTILNKETKELETYNIHTGELVGTNSSVAISSKIVFDLDIAEYICMQVREGATMKQISAKPNMPSYHVILSWAAIHKDFGRALERAKQDRATVYHDKAVEILEKDDYLDKDSLNNAKFKFDGFVKLAEKGNPDAYAAKPTTVVAGGSAAPTIIVNTGITRIPKHVEGDSYAEATITHTERDGGVQTLSAGDTDITIDTGITGKCRDGEGFAGAEGGVSEGIADSSSLSEGYEEYEEESN